MAAYSKGSTPQQRRWLYDQILGGSALSQEQIDRFVAHMFGKQSTLEFLPASVSPVPHALRLQDGFVAMDQLQRRYHPYPEGDHDSLDDGFFETSRFFVATIRESWMRKEGEEEEDERAQLPRPGDELILHTVEGTRLVTRVSSVPEIRTASAQVVLEDSLRLRSNASRFARMVAREHATLFGIT